MVHRHSSTGVLLLISPLLFSTLVHLLFDGCYAHLALLLPLLLKSLLLLVELSFLLLERLSQLLVPDSQLLLSTLSGCNMALNLPLLTLHFWHQPVLLTLNRVSLHMSHGHLFRCNLGGLWNLISTSRGRDLCLGVVRHKSQEGCLLLWLWLGIDDHAVPLADTHWHTLQFSSFLLHLGFQVLREVRHWRFNVILLSRVKSFTESCLLLWVGYYKGIR